ncbi:glycosyltransferase family 4 protein [Solibacillus sp. NPDC093137]|uniref:glycosyltransferase family 4 protein n=1 Tax=Solibacillus sp. NPDC093137 TaxID=3390678 RepID=UPI003D04D098
MKKKVLFVASLYRHLTSFHIPYIHYFQSIGYEVYAGAGEDVKVREELEMIGVQCIDISFNRNPFSKGNITAYQQLKKLFSEMNFELVHVHTPVAALITRKAFKLMSNHGKIVYTAHGFHFFEGAPKKNWFFYYTAEKIAAKWTDHLITINKEDYYNAQKFLPNNQVSYIHGVGVESNSIRLSEEEKANLKKEIGLSADQLMISYVAELNKNKNHQFLLRIWLQLKERCPQAVLCLIGTGELEQELKELITAKNLEDIYFLGYRRDVPSILQISDIVTLLSYREGLPKSIMEAMVEGLPCIVTNTRGLRDLVFNEENGYVVKHDDEEALVNAFEQLLKSKELREIMGNKGKVLVQPYLLENVLLEYVAVYEKILGDVNGSEVGTNSI